MDCSKVNSSGTYIQLPSSIITVSLQPPVAVNGRFPLRQFPLNASASVQPEHSPPSPSHSPQEST